jgi:hypothetical protein
MFEFFKESEQLQCRQALCIVHVHLPAGYRPLKWNDLKFAEAIEDIGFFGFVPGPMADINAVESPHQFIPEATESASSPDSHE